VHHPLVEPVVAWFGRSARDLPWRAPGRTPWGVLVSEVMLQQTPVARVVPLWSAWMERWPTPADLAAAGTDEVLRAWDRLGYPRRALRLQRCARVLVEHHGGTLPVTEAELLALPGIGTYTAAAVTSFAHGHRAVVVDTNVRRVLARAVDGVALPAPHLSAEELRRADDVVPHDDASATRWNAAVMELGALICTARAPRCEACPVQDACAWRAAGMPADALAHRRRRQGWAGTDRQVRGRIMSELRAARRAVPLGELVAATTDSAQLERSLAGLLSDGLLVAAEVVDADGRRAAAYALPGAAAATTEDVARPSARAASAP
jgi:A/G-specific adenine glycosylase